MNALSLEENHHLVRNTGKHHFFTGYKVRSPSPHETERVKNLIYTLFARDSPSAIFVFVLAFVILSLLYWVQGSQPPTT